MTAPILASSFGLDFVLWVLLLVFDVICLLGGLVLLCLASLDKVRGRGGATRLFWIAGALLGLAVLTWFYLKNQPR